MANFEETRNGISRWIMSNMEGNFWQLISSGKSRSATTHLYQVHQICSPFELTSRSLRSFFQKRREEEKRKILELFSNAFNPLVSRPINFRPCLSFSESRDARERE